MKKNLLMLFVVLGATITANAFIRVEVQRVDKGLFGYDRVTEDFRQTGGDCFYSLLCSGGGWTGCRWNSLNLNNPPAGCQNIAIGGNGPKDALNDVLSYIEQEVTNGSLNGTVSYPSVLIENPSNGVMEPLVFTWTATSLDDIVFFMYSHSEAEDLGII